MKEIDTNNNVGGKTPDEIKKGLKSCGKGTVCRRHCPYYGPKFDIKSCIGKLSIDALAYIEQLEKRNNRLEYTLMGVMHSVDKWLKVEPYDFDKDDGTEAATRAANAREIALKAIEQLEWKKDIAEAHAIAKTFVIDRLKRERDAAVEDIPRECHKCKHFKVLFNGCTPDYDCDLSDVCKDNDNWEWSGVPEPPKE